MILGLIGGVFAIEAVRAGLLAGTAISEEKERLREVKVRPLLLEQAPFPTDFTLTTSPMARWKVR